MLYIPCYMVLSLLFLWYCPVCSVLVSISPPQKNLRNAVLFAQDTSSLPTDFKEIAGYALWGSHLYTMNFGWLTHTEFFWKYYLYLQRIEFTASSLISKSKWRPFLILDSHISPPGLQFCSFHLVCIPSRHQWKKHAFEKEKLNMVISYICKSWL